MVSATVWALEDIGAQFAGATTGQSPEQSTRTGAQPEARFQPGQELAQDAPHRVAGRLQRRHGGTEPVHE